MVTKYQVKLWKEEGMETTGLLKKIIQYRTQREMKKNGYPFCDPNKTMVNFTKVPSDAHKNNLKEDIFKISLRISWRRY
jgi:hypothetical protein